MESASTQTRIEVVMAVHQPRLDFLRKQIESISGQSHENWGLTLVFDGEHPEVRDAVGDWVDGDPRVVCEVISGHSGCGRTFENGLKLLADKDCLIALADQDDVWDRRKLEILCRAFDQHPETLMAFSDSCIIDEHDRVVAPSLHASEERIPAFSVSSLLARNSISGHSQVFRSRLLEHALPFPEDMRGIELHHDHWLAMVAAVSGPIRFVRENLVSHRLHEGNHVGPRIGRGGAAGSGLGAWAAQNRRLHRALRTRFDLLGRLPEFQGESFGRLQMLAWGGRALLGGNPPATAIYLRAFCARQSSGPAAC